MNNISLNTLRMAIQTLENGSGTDPQQAGQTLSSAQAQNQSGGGDGLSLMGDGAQKGIHFGTIAQPPSSQKIDGQDPASADSQGNSSQSSDPTSQLLAEVMKAVMQWLQSLLSNSGDSDSGQDSSTPAVAASQGVGNTQGVQDPTDSQGSLASPGAGASVPDTTPSVAAPGAGGGVGQTAASVEGGGAQTASSVGSSPASGVSDNSAANGSAGLNLPPALEQLRSGIQDASNATGIPANVIAGLVYAESRGQNNAATTNVTGNADLGPAQVDTNTFNALKQQNPAQLGNGDINNPHDNIMAGALYLRDQSNAFGGDMGAALRAYNSGPGNVNRNNLSDTGGAGDPNYVNHVLNFAQIIGSGNGQLPA